MRLNLLILCLLFSINAQSQQQQFIYKDAAAPDACPLVNSRAGIQDEYLNTSIKADTKVVEPYTEGCLTLKTIYVNNLITALALDLGENKNCIDGGKCGSIKGSDEIATAYKELTAYLTNTQKADVKKALQNNPSNINNLIINQLQVMAQLRFKDTVYDQATLAKVNQNINNVFKLDLNLKTREVDAAKTQVCNDYVLTCPLQLADPARATDKCKNLLKSPMPAYCTTPVQAAVANYSNSSAATVAASLTDAQAEEYLNLNLDVKAAYEKKAATDNRSKAQYASDHYRDFSEAEGRPRSVKEYLDCNPDVGYGFNDPAVNTNLDAAKTDLTAFVAKHFQYLIQPIVPVSSRNFKTFGCIDLEKYLMCNPDVKKHCTEWSNGDRDFVNKSKICAFNHYRDNGKKEGRTDSCN